MPSPPPDPPPPPQPALSFAARRWIRPLPVAHAPSHCSIGCDNNVPKTTGRGNGCCCYWWKLTSEEVHLDWPEE
uniref:Uncharacterized protein n=1 Tax=Oryza glumipatula TaxID=40148 RepID=A0A0E0AEV8_9ORYZ